MAVEFVMVLLLQLATKIPNPEFEEETVFEMELKLELERYTP